ncbi:hypothetical protein D3C84_637540 [compost metagenome]
MFFDLGHGLGIDQRPLLRIVRVSGTDLQLVDRGHQSSREFIVDTVLHQDSIGAYTDLPAIVELRTHGAFDRCIQVRIFEHDEGGVAAQLKADFLDGFGALRHQGFADTRRTRERDLLHTWIAGPLGADFTGTVAGDDVQNAGGDTRTLTQFSQGQCGQRGFRRRLYNYRATSGQCWANFASNHCIGKFRGVMAATTPMAYLITTRRP